MVFLFLYSVFSALIKQSFNKNHIKELSYFLFGLLCGIWFISLGAVHFDLVFYPGDLGDARFNNYLLEHGYRYLVGQDKYFWNADFMYPEAEVISYSDNLLGTVPFYALCRVFGADRETAFQIWYLLMVVLNYTAAFFFFRFLV